MTIDPEERLLLAATAASLSRRGWPAARTAALLAEALPPGRTRDELASAATALSAGAPASDGAGSDLVTLLARADAGGAEALAELARAESLAMRARRASSAALVYPASSLALALVLATLATAVLPTLDFLRPEPSAFTGFAATVTSIAAAAMLTVSVAWIALAASGRFLPGARALRVASALRQARARISAGIPAAEAFAPEGASGTSGAIDLARLGLDARERALGTRLLETQSPGDAAGALASELERDGRDAQRTARLLFPVAGMVLLVGAAGLVVIAVILPLFSQDWM